jgi:hypothetical protein
MSMPATRPAAAPAVEAVIKQVIEEKFGGPAACTLPEDKEVFSHHEAAFERVQRYAFANGFAVQSHLRLNDNRGAQTAFILFSTFLDLRPVSAANDLQASKNGRLEIRISKSKTPV